MGMAASWLFLLTAGRKGKRSALRTPGCMMHQPSAHAGTASDIEIQAREILFLRRVNECIQHTAKLEIDRKGSPRLDLDVDACLRAAEGWCIMIRRAAG